VIQAPTPSCPGFGGGREWVVGRESRRGWSRKDASEQSHLEKQGWRKERDTGGAAVALLGTQ
jgi:hypothetical protein